MASHKFTFFFFFLLLCFPLVAQNSILQSEEPVDSLSDLLAVDPHDADAYFLRGYSLFQQNKLEAALRDLNQSLRLNPEDATAYYIRAQVQARLERPRYAIEDYTLAIRHNPNYHSAYYRRAELRHRVGENEKALDDLVEVLDIRPDYIPAYLLRARIHAAMEDSQSAMEVFAQARSLAPENPEVLAALADFFMVASDPAYHRPAEALDLATQAYRLAPTAKNLDRLAIAHGENGNFRLAETMARDALAQEETSDYRKHAESFAAGQSWSETLARRQKEAQAAREREMEATRKRQAIWESIVKQNQATGQK